MKYNSNENRQAAVVNIYPFPKAKYTIITVRRKLGLIVST